MAAGESWMKDYPNIVNPNLPFLIGCIHEHGKTEAEKGFQRVCYNKVRIAAVEAVKSNTWPSCIWRIYYELKQDTVELQNDDSTGSLDSDILPADFPTSEESLKKLFEDITVAAIQFLGMKVLRKFVTKNGFTAIVEYSPHRCQCVCLDNMATEDPRRWPNVTEAEVALAQIRIEDMQR